MSGIYLYITARRNKHFWMEMKIVVNTFLFFFLLRFTDDVAVAIIVSDIMFFLNGITSPSFLF